MKRIKLVDRSLPDYTRGEEIFNMVSHIVGAVIGIAVLFLCVAAAAARRSVSGAVCGAVFGLSMILLYTMSSVYHGLTTVTSKKVFQILDHCTIYFLIAGTYTPILICAVRYVDPVACWITFGFVWGLTVLAVTLNAIDLKKYERFSMLCYIGMGWCVIFSLRATVKALDAAQLWLLFAGGILYTAGAVLFKLGKRRRYFHSVFHLLTVLGSICHSLCVLGILYY